MKLFRTTKITGLFALLALLFATSSCVDELFLDGNGITQSEFRMASGFNQITSGGDFDVIVEPGSNYSIEVTAESNLLSYIETDVVGNTLRIHTRGLYSLRQNEPIEIRIATPVLKGVTLSGSGYIQTGSFMSDDFHIVLSGSGDIGTQVSADQVKANISGSGTIFLEGDAFESEFVISGPGKIKSYNFEQEDCHAVISGSGDMYVNASRTIDASISGSGRVYFVNHPVIHTSISGSGRVVDKN